MISLIFLMCFLGTPESVMIKTLLFLPISLLNIVLEKFFPFICIWYFEEPLPAIIVVIFYFFANEIISDATSLEDLFSVSTT